jgi:hypothetical protein
LPQWTQRKKFKSVDAKDAKGKRKVGKELGNGPLRFALNPFGGTLTTLEIDVDTGWQQGFAYFC